MAIRFDIQNVSGLTESCAAQRLREEGYNELPSSAQRSVLAIALEVVREPMFLMLVACGGLYMLMGELTDALMLLGFVFVVMGITIVQERRTERALEALKDLSSPRALVIRDGRQKRIAGRDVARGDMILLAEGDRVPADAMLLQGINLSVDESLLTGESVPVRKAPSPGAATMGPPGGDDLPFLYSGTLVTGGQGVGEVQRTGLRTELGKIGKAIQTVEPEQTLLQKETGRLVRYLAVVGLALCAIVVIAYALSRGNSADAWQQGLLAGITMAMATMAGQGLRVIAVAEGRLRRTELPHEQHDVDFAYLGLVGLADPVRPGVPDAIRECYDAGVRVVMITGDYPITAQSIARQVGLEARGGTITGPELDATPDEELARQIRNVNVFARVVPEQKLRIVNALKANGEIVAMTGDGVNDAPALKSAHIGIAMGGRGTDVAREASALVLLQDDFTSIVQAVKLGRRIFDNIKKAVSYVFAIHVPIAGLSMVPVFFADWPLLLLPIHVVFLELIIDPACSVIFEAENAEPNTMKRPPRDPKERLFSLRSVGLSLLQGASVLTIVLAVFWAARALGHPDNDARRALVFATLVVANLCLILTNRSWSRTIISMFREPNAALWWVLGGTALMLTLVLTVPFLRDLFHFSRLHAADMAVFVVAGVVSITWFELLKVLRAKVA